jgi:mono/diheme cytochrome c family protein
MQKAAIIVFLLLGSLLFARGQSQSPVARVQPPPSTEDRERLLAIGKKLFLERCSKCHDERGDKALKSGPPLSERKLSDEEILRTVSGRFRDAPQEEKRAVALYISSFMKRK